jgi:hypothetical protein
MAGDIEFLPEEFDDEPPAELEPRAPREPWPPWWRAAALAVAFLAFVAWIATRPAGTKQPNAGPLLPSSSATPSTSAPPPVIAVQPVHVNSHMVLCPNGVPVQIDIRRAMRRYFPKVVVSYPLSYHCSRGIGIDERIVFESVRGRYRGLMVTIELTTPMPDGIPSFASEGSDSGLVQLGSVALQSPGLQVEISASGPYGSTAPYRQMHELADYLGQNIRL